MISHELSRNVGQQLTENSRWRYIYVPSYFRVEHSTHVSRLCTSVQLRGKRVATRSTGGYYFCVTSYSRMYRNADIRSPLWSRAVGTRFSTITGRTLLLLSLAISTARFRQRPRCNVQTLSRQTPHGSILKNERWRARSLSPHLVVC